MYSERFALASGMMYEDDLSAMKKGKGEMAMGKWSSIGALMNKIENNQMLSEAKRLTRRVLGTAAPVLSSVVLVSDHTGFCFGNSHHPGLFLLSYDSC